MLALGQGPFGRCAACCDHRRCIRCKGRCIALRSPRCGNVACNIHGHAIAKHIQRTSKEVLQVETGSLYPALGRLEQKGWIDSEWQRTEANRRAKYYRLTTPGRKQLTIETREWDRMQNAIGRVMKLA